MKIGWFAGLIVVALMIRPQPLRRETNLFTEHD